MALLFGGLEPILSHTEKSCITSYYKQFSTNIKIKIIRLIPVLSGRVSRRDNKAVFNLKILHFNIRGKLSIIRCDK